MYVCQKCWRDVCERGHDKKTFCEGTEPLFLFVISLLFLSTPIFFSALTTYDIVLRDHWARMETSQVAELQEGDVVRLDGFIVGNFSTLALGGEFDDDNSWKWDDDAAFNFGDETGEINVSVKHYYVIKNGPHLTEESNRNRIYRGGDWVVIIGKVTEENGELKLDLLWMAENDNDLAPGFWSYVLLSILLCILIPPYAYLSHLTFKRGKRHKENIREGKARKFQSANKIPDPSLDWRANRLPRYLRRPLVVLLTLLALAIILYQGIPSHKNDLDGMTLVWSFILMALVIPWTSELGRNHILPNMMATSPHGVHFYCRNSVEQHVCPDLIPWEDIWRIKKEYAYRSSFWLLDRTNLPYVKLGGGLSRGNRKYLMNELEIHRKQNPTKPGPGTHKDVRCPACAARFRVKNPRRPLKVKCPGCAKEITLK